MLLPMEPGEVELPLDLFVTSCQTGSQRAEIATMRTAQQGLRAGRLDSRFVELPALVIMFKEKYPARYS